MVLGRADQPLFLRATRRCAQAGKPAGKSATLATHASHSLHLPGGGRQAHGSVRKIGRPDFR